MFFFNMRCCARLEESLLLVPRLYHNVIRHTSLPSRTFIILPLLCVEPIERQIDREECIVTVNVERAKETSVVEEQSTNTKETSGTDHCTMNYSSAVFLAKLGFYRVNST
jgi:hypothetical protein